MKSINDNTGKNTGDKKTKKTGGSRVDAKKPGKAGGSRVDVKKTDKAGGIRGDVRKQEETGNVHADVKKKEKADNIRGNVKKSGADKKLRVCGGKKADAGSGRSGLQPAQKRIAGKGGCPYAEKCGGCDYQGVPYEEQLKRKQSEVKALLGKFTEPAPILGAVHHEHYRNKVHGVFGRDKKGNVYTGIYEEGTHRIVPVKDCRIENVRAAAILKTLSVLAKQFKLQIYDEDRETGLLRHALIRTGAVTGQIMVTLVLSNPIMPSKNNFTKELCRLHPEITTIVLNINPKRTSMVLGDRNIVLYGKGYIEDELCGLKFRISPSSFYQINPEQTEVLYRKAMEFAQLTGTERVIDAYCGIGTIGMCAAKQAAEVWGVELNRDAVKDAVSNAKLNQMKNIRFLAEDAGNYMIRLAAEKESADIVFMDPPRSGSTKEFINAVHMLNPKRVVYVSCNPVTLKRDLEIFAGKGWKVRKIQPVDMFPYTAHVETVVQLSKGDIDRDSSERKSIAKTDDIGMISGYNKGNKASETTNVKIDFSLENLDLSELRGR